MPHSHSINDAGHTHEVLPASLRAGPIAPPALVVFEVGQTVLARKISGIRPGQSEHVAVEAEIIAINPSDKGDWFEVMPVSGDAKSFKTRRAGLTVID